MPVIALDAGHARAATVALATEDCRGRKGGCLDPPHTLDIRDAQGQANDLVITVSEGALVASCGCVAPGR